MSTGFDVAAEGYDRSQVNTVLQGVNERYQQLYAQYSELHTQASALQMENERLRALLMQADAREQERGSAPIVAPLAEPAQLDEAMFRQFMDLIVRHALNIVRDAKAIAAITEPVE